jgi:hypothetical protein
MWNSTHNVEDPGGFNATRLDKTRFSWTQTNLICLQQAGMGLLMTCKRIAKLAAVVVSLTCAPELL